MEAETLKSSDEDTAIKGTTTSKPHKSNAPTTTKTTSSSTKKDESFQSNENKKNNKTPAIKVTTTTSKSKKNKFPQKFLDVSGDAVPDVDTTVDHVSRTFHGWIVTS